jgi:hypothetical protein
VNAEEGNLLDDDEIQNLPDFASTLSMLEPQETNWYKLKHLFNITMKGGAVFNPRSNEIAYISNENGVAQIFKQRFFSYGKLMGSPKLLLSTKDRCTTPTFLVRSQI